MKSKNIGHWSFVLGSIFILAGCEGGGTSGRSSDDNRPVQAGGRVSKNDVEAPDLFNTQEKGLWDGRPSLGGVWVAHPSVTTPQRVIIRNTENGKSTVGALFRRERENPGPRIQLSSDAADRLGILAGQPAQLSVIALKREEVEEETKLPISDESPTDDTSAAEGADSDDIAAAAAQAIENVDGDAASDGETPAVQPVAEECSPSSFGRRCRTKPPVAATPAPDAAATAEEGAANAEATESGAAPADATAVQPVPETRSPSSFGRRSSRRANREAPAADVATDAAASDVTSAPLDATAGAPETPAAAPAQAASNLRNSYLQAGTFTTEANANSAAQAMRGQGLNASVRQQKRGSNTLWRVVVGPANNRAEQRQQLEKLKGLGYPDAFPVRG